MVVVNAYHVIEALRRSFTNSCMYVACCFKNLLFKFNQSFVLFSKSIDCNFARSVEGTKDRKRKPSEKACKRNARQGKTVQGYRKSFKLEVSA